MSEYVFRSKRTDVLLSNCIIAETMGQRLPAQNQGHFILLRLSDFDPLLPRDRLGPERNCFCTATSEPLRL